MFMQYGQIPHVSECMEETEVNTCVLFVSFLTSFTIYLNILLNLNLNG